jgi:hypothetical protein
MATAAGKPQDAFQGMASGAVSMGWDIISREDFVGRSVRVQDPVGFGLFLMRSFTPFAAEEVPAALGQIAEGTAKGDIGQVASGAALIGSEFTGMKTAPLSFTDVADDVAKEMGFGDEYREAARSEKVLINKDERVQRASEKRARKGAWAALERQDELRLEEEAALVEEFQGTLEDVRRPSGRQFRDRYAQIQGETAAVYAAWDEAFKLFKKTKELPKDKNERALVQHFLAQETAKLPSGRFDFDRFDETVESYGWTSEQIEYVETNTQGITEHPPLIQQFLRDRKMLADLGYFDITKNFVEKPIFNIPEGDYEEYLTIYKVSQSRWLSTHPELKAAFDAAAIEKRNIRERGNPIDGLMALVKWGYIESLSSVAYDRWVKELKRRQAASNQ